MVYISSEYYSVNEERQQQQKRRGRRKKENRSSSFSFFFLSATLVAFVVSLSLSLFCHAFGLYPSMYTSRCCLLHHVILVSILENYIVYMAVDLKKRIEVEEEDDGENEGKSEG